MSDVTRCAQHEQDETLRCLRCKRALCERCHHFKVSGRPWCPACTATLAPTRGEDSLRLVRGAAVVLVTLGWMIATPWMVAALGALAILLGGFKLGWLWPVETSPPIAPEEWRDGALVKAVVIAPVGSLPRVSFAAIGAAGVALIAAAFVAWWTGPWWRGEPPIVWNKTSIESLSLPLPGQIDEIPAAGTPHTLAGTEPYSEHFVFATGASDLEIYYGARLSFRLRLNEYPVDFQRMLVETHVTRLLKQRARLEVKGYEHVGSVRDTGTCAIAVADRRVWPGGTFRVRARWWAVGEELYFVVGAGPERSEVIARIDKVLGESAIDRPQPKRSGR